MKPTITTFKKHRKITGYAVRYQDLIVTTDDPAAKQATIDKLETLVAEACTYRSPNTDFHSFAGKTYVLTVMPGMYGWEYSLTEVSADGKEGHTAHSTCGTLDDRSAAWGYAKSHLAQNIYDHSPESRAYGCMLLKNYPNELRSFESWCDWQERFQIVKTKGYSSNDCHRLACETRTHAEAHAIPVAEMERAS